MARHPNRASESSRLRIVFSSILFIAATIAVVGGTGSSRAISQPVEDNAFHRKIAPWVIERAPNGQKAQFFVVLTDQADLSGAINLATKAEKGRFVYQELTNKSQTTQRSILQWLRERGIEHRSFYIVNAILVKGSREVAEALAADMSGRIKVIRTFEIRCLSLPRLLTACRCRINRRQSNRTSPHARAGCMGAGVQRTGNYSWRRRYWTALDTQRAEASVPRLGWSRGGSRLQLA